VLRFRDGGGTDTLGARFELPQGDFGTLVRLPVGADPYSHRSGVGTHLIDVGFQNIQVDEQCRSLEVISGEFVRAHGDQSIKEKADFQAACLAKLLTILALPSILRQRILCVEE
jgi:hypothetical protein